MLHILEDGRDEVVGRPRREPAEHPSSFTEKGVVCMGPQEGEGGGQFPKA